VLNINNITDLGCIYTTEILNLTNESTCQQQKLTPYSEVLLWVNNDTFVPITKQDESMEVS
jgi:hypothetical protein